MAVNYVLASASPRRRELLEQIGMRFAVSPAAGEEVITKDLPWDVVEELSYRKACEVAERCTQGMDDKSDTTVIISADTVVACGREIMGKPRDDADAVRMLTKLQGGAHEVYTGVTLFLLGQNGKRTVTFHEKTDVCIYPMTGGQIASYVATGEPADKAGAYAIQGKFAVYIKSINGEYNNVVGLPVGRLAQELSALGLAWE